MNICVLCCFLSHLLLLRFRFSWVYRSVFISTSSRYSDMLDEDELYKQCHDSEPQYSFQNLIVIILVSFRDFSIVLAVFWHLSSFLGNRGSVLSNWDFLPSIFDKAQNYIVAIATAYGRFRFGQNIWSNPWVAIYWICRSLSSWYVLYL